VLLAEDALALDEVVPSLVNDLARLGRRVVLIRRAAVLGP
jgi:hypothetical protein